MGYELKMIVVEKINTMVEKTCLIDGEVFSCHTEKGKQKYFDDSDRELPVPKGTKVISGSWCKFLGIFDLSKAGVDFGGICDFKDSDGCYVYEPFDGNKFIGLDLYGSYRKFVPIDSVIKILKEKIKGEEPYRRFTVALAMLEEIKKTFRKDAFSEPGCLFYGF